MRSSLKYMLRSCQNGLIVCATMLTCSHISLAARLENQSIPTDARKAVTQQNADALAQLRDIRMPSPIGWWPPAPGWFVLGFVLVLLVCFAAVWGGWRYRHGKAKREALKLLEEYFVEHQKNANSSLCSARISELLKRVALAYFPRDLVAGLQGEEWLLFLNQTAKDVDFTRVRVELLELPYQASMASDISLLFELSRKWIRQRRGSCLN